MSVILHGDGLHKLYVGTAVGGQVKLTVRYTPMPGNDFVDLQFYRRHVVQMREPALRCNRAKRNDELIAQVQRVWHANMQVYGADQVWKQMKWEGIAGACHIHHSDRGSQYISIRY